MTQAQATELARATEIARERGHKVFTATVNATGATCYSVRSATDPNTFHILHIAGGRIVCDCSAHHHGHICSHAAAVRLFLIAQRDALTAVEVMDAQAAEAERLTNLPRELANVTDSQEARAQRQADREAYVERDFQHYMEAANERYAKAVGRRCAELEQAKREHAILATDDRPFSIYRSE